jgi:nucleoside-diphosphate-sugar epimerase
MKKKILILGSSGMIGSYLSKYLNKKYTVLHFDLLNSNKEDLRIQKNNLLKKKIKQSDFVFFLAFDVGGSGYLEKYQNTFDFINNNLRIMINTFEVLKFFKKKFIFASSTMSDLKFSTYGNLKSIGEKYTYSLGGVVVKFWNVYGYETQSEEKMHVINDFIIKGLKYGTIKTLTDGRESRDFLFVEDCNRALEIIMNNFNKLKKFRSIDIAYNKFTTIKKVAAIIKNIFIYNKIKIEFSFSRKKDMVHNNKKNYPNLILNKYWKPKISLKEGIEKIFYNHLNKLR